MAEIGTMHYLVVAMMLFILGVVGVVTRRNVVVILMSIAGFFSGLTMPSRDMIVRAVTPPGAYGRVFGFVSTGFNIGGIVSPLRRLWPI